MKQKIINGVSIVAVILYFTEMGLNIFMKTSVPGLKEFSMGVISLFICYSINDRDRREKTSRRYWGTIAGLVGIVNMIDGVNEIMRAFS